MVVDNGQQHTDYFLVQDQTSSFQQNATRSQLGQHQIQIDFLQEKLKELEMQLVDRRKDVRPYSSVDLLYQQHISMQWKDQEINQLHAKLGKARSELDIYQKHYDTDLGRLRLDITQKKDQLGTLKCRVSELESECLMWRDRAAAMEQSFRSAPSPADLTRSEYRIGELEQDNCSLRRTIESLHKICHNLKRKCAQNGHSKKESIDKERLEVVIQKLRSDLEWMQIENGALSSSLQAKECQVNEIMVNKNNKNPTYSNQLDASDADLLRECGFLANCLQDTLRTLADGKLPNINRLLACKSSSTESMASAGGCDTASGGVKCQVRALNGCLQELQATVAKYYANHVADNSSCHVQ